MLPSEIAASGRAPVVAASRPGRRIRLVRVASKPVRAGLLHRAQKASGETDGFLPRGLLLPRARGDAAGDPLAREHASSWIPSATALQIRA